MTRIRSLSRRRSKRNSSPQAPETLKATGCAQTQETLNDAAIAAILVELEREQPGSRGRSSPRFRGSRGRETSENDEAIAAALTAALSEEERTEARERQVRRTRSTERSSVNPVQAPRQQSDELDMETISALLSSLHEHGDETIDATSRRSQAAEGRPPTSTSHPVDDPGASSWFDGVPSVSGLFEGNWITDSSQWLGSWFGSGPVPPELACVACLDRQADACLIPCGHINLCMACSARLPNPKRCPMCRIGVDHVVKAGQRSQTD